jgi:hypothetical protein
MKCTVALFVLFAVCLFACKKSHPMDGGFSVVCICTKGAVSQTFQLGNKYNPYVDTDKVNPIYQDSCNTLEKQNGFDSCHVQAITL